MRLKYDMNVGALYVRLTDAPVARTHEVDDNTMIDLAVDGSVIGIEVISITHPWPIDVILAEYPIPELEKTQLRAYFKSPVLNAAPGHQPMSTTPEAPAVSTVPNAPVCVSA